MLKSHQIVLKGVNWVHHAKIRSYGLGRSQLGTQYKNQVILVFKGINCVHNDKIKSYGLERSQLITQ